MSQTPNRDLDRRGFIKAVAATGAAVGCSEVVPAPATPPAQAATQPQEIPVRPETLIRAIEPLSFPWQTSDPFLFCAHHDDAYPRGNAEMGPDASLAGRRMGSDFEGKDGWSMYHGQTVPGFPVHPHRGFETVTLARRGFIDHSDSMGATARFGEGDAQWMTAGKGITHSEMFPLRSQTAENPTELFQVWLNLPRANKMVTPHFTMIWKEEIPTHTFKDDQGKRVEVVTVAGALAGVPTPTPPPKSWASHPEAEVAIWTITLDPGARWVMPPVSEGVERSLYVFLGDQVKVAGKPIARGHRVVLATGDPAPLEAGDEPVQILLLQGRPINEPVVQYGPFVMNTRDEIRQAFRDYQTTGFGEWPWPRPDPIHPREQGRFARHADGKVEQKA